MKTGENDIPIAKIPSFQVLAGRAEQAEDEIDADQGNSRVPWDSRPAVIICGAISLVCAIAQLTRATMIVRSRDASPETAPT
jgi:hypothetical protein